MAKNAAMTRKRNDFAVASAEELVTTEALIDGYHFTGGLVTCQDHFRGYR
jgi:hypothetical protein